MFFDTSFSSPRKENCDDQYRFLIVVYNKLSNY